MRRFVFALAALALLVVGSAVALAGPVASGPNGEKYVLDVDVYPGTGKAAKAHAVGIQLSSYLNLSSGEKPPQPSQVMRFDKSLVFNFAGLPACDRAALEATGPSACPESSEIGSGTAVADLRPSGPAALAASLTLYRGAPEEGSNGDSLLLAYAVPEGSTSGVVFFFYLRDDPQGPYRFALQDPGPASGSSEAGVALTEFEVNTPPAVYKVKKNGKQKLVAGVEAKPCKGGVRRFDSELTFATGELLTANDISGCAP